jgi:hypothetical protein
MNIKDYMNDDIFAVLNSFVAKLENRLGSNMYVGTVVQHDDYATKNGAPDPTIGKCRIMVYGIYDNIPIEKLPWAMPDEQWVGSQAGSFIIPPLGALVRVTFESDSIYRPIYSGKVLQAKKMDDVISKNYPHNMLMWSTDAGSSLQHDRKTGEEIKTNVIGSYTPETVKYISNSGGESFVVTDAAASLSSEGKIVETIYGAASTVGNSFYNKKMDITGASALDSINIAMDGTLTYEHKISGNDVKLEITSGGVLKITSVLGGSTHTITLDSSGINLTDQWGNKITYDASGITLKSPNKVKVDATSIDLTCPTSLGTITNGMALPGMTGSPTCVPSCLFNGATHFINKF